MNRQSIYIYKFHLLLLLFGINFMTVTAEELKVNSRMSYYTTEENAEIMIYIPSGKGNAFLDGKSYSLESGVNLIPVKVNTLEKGVNKRLITIEYQGNKKDYSVNIVYLSAKANEVKIDYTTGGLYVDGLPFLPTGFYSSLNGNNYTFLKNEVSQGINLYSPYHNIIKENQNDRMGYLDLCAQLGI